MYIQDESNVNNIYYNCTETSGNVVTRTTKLLDCQWKGMGSPNKIIYFKFSAHDAFLE